MTFSKLCNLPPLPHHNKHRGRGGVKRLIVHHWAGTAGGAETLGDPNIESSATYIIYSNGDLQGQVPEEFDPWTTGPAGDKDSVTVEIQNSTGAPTYQVSELALQTLARLMADLATRYNWPEIKLGTTVNVHRNFTSTSCPGDYVLSKLPAVIRYANSEVEYPNTDCPDQSKWNANRDIALEVYQGNHGNGQVRIDNLRRLGYNPEIVQAEINRRFY